MRRLLAEGVIGDLVMASFTTIAERPKEGGDWRNDEDVAGGDAFFEEGIHWLHLAGSLGPRIVQHLRAPTRGRRATTSGDRRGRSMLVAFDYDTGAVGVAALLARDPVAAARACASPSSTAARGVITFESNGGAVLVRGKGRPRVVLPGYRDIRGYRAMYRDFVSAIRTGRQPEMSVERALEDHLLMEAVAWLRRSTTQTW